MKRSSRSNLLSVTRSSVLVLSGLVFLVVGVAELSASAATPGDAPLPAGVRAVWDLKQAYREGNSQRERICINGLWRWQPDTKAEGVPESGWGYFKVPGCWPGVENYLQHDCQTVFAHPNWEGVKFDGLTAAWYQREVGVPPEWAGRRITLCLEYLNSSATVFLDGVKAGEAHFPAGEVDLTPLCRPGNKHVLSLRVVARPLREVMLMFNDTNAAHGGAAKVDRRGLCGDVYLAAAPAGARLGNVRVDTSVRKGQITLHAALENLRPQTSYVLRAAITDRGRPAYEFTGKPFTAGDLQDGCCELTAAWKPERRWDLHTPGNVYEATVSLVEAAGTVVDAALPVRFGFRELWIDGRDFYLNGTRIFLSALPLDNAQVSASAASYAGAKESLLRLKRIGINFVYTHNYGCEPGSHLGFEEVLHAADDVGMLVALSQPHFAQYDWRMPDASQKNAYADHARFYVRVAGSHPSVVFYAMSHNATGYDEDKNPDMIDGLQAVRNPWSENNVKGALAAEAIVTRLDPGRIVYHHSSGNLGSMHTMNFYTNMAPLQELDDWFEHWANRGVKPVFTCEYMVPCTWDFTMYRGWYKGGRTFGNARVPWEFCIAEWSSQFLGDRAYRVGEAEKQNIRWEAEQFRQGKLWHRWDYPHEVGARVFDNQHEVIGAYLAANWRAFRTWGVSAISPWEYTFYWTLRKGVDKSRQSLAVAWDTLQRPGFSPDYLDSQYERMDLAFQWADWIPTADGAAILRNNQPLLAYLAGKPAAFTSKDHNFHPGETVEKQVIVINNSREPVSADCRWSLGLPEPVAGTAQATIATGQQQRIALRAALPAGLPPGEYALNAEVRFNTGEVQNDSFTIHVLPRPAAVPVAAKIAVFDPQGQTAALLDALHVEAHAVAAGDDLSGYDMLVVGKGALTVDKPAPNLQHVREGLKVLLFEQTAQALERRLGFRVTEYGLRQVFPRLPNHPLLAGLRLENLRDWRGSATITPPKLDYITSQAFGGPAVKWCGIEVPRVWRCGNRGNVASVLIEKPARGDFLPIVDGGYSLQYSPLLEYHEGRGLVLFCQLDVTGRTEQDPVADILAGNLLRYVAGWKPAVQRQALYAGGPSGRRYLEFAGIALETYAGGKLPPEQVLVAAAGGTPLPADSASAIADFLRAGGRLLCLGLDQQAANAMLPFHVGMTQAEHLACPFDLPPAGSLLAGVAPADVYNRDPRPLPLVSSGAAVLGDGVLAQAEKANVVFYQHPPYTITSAQGAVPSLVVDGQEALEGKHSALVTLGMTAGSGVQLGQRLKLAPQVGKTYTFAAFVKGVGGPVLTHLEVERAGSPWDRAVKGLKVSVPDGQWTELHVTFPCRTSFPEGWSAYLACAQDGGSFRADLFRLYEGDYVPGKTAASATGTRDRAGAQNFFVNAGFESGQKGWFFMFDEQLNLRRTYRRSGFALARLLANLGVAAPTPLLARFATPVDTEGPPPGPSVIRNGDFRRAGGPRSVADQWEFSCDARQASCRREPAEAGGWALRLTKPGTGAPDKATLMLAQQGVPVKEGQWYCISLQARAEGLGGKNVTLALQDTRTWKSLFDYQSFVPNEKWHSFRFLVQANGTADQKTRFQIWHGQSGTLWLADIALQPVTPPTTEGRWSQGLYLDQPEAWDDPYRFFCW
jgi:beta-galactosidase/beta-glucuronidase